MTYPFFKFVYVVLSNASFDNSSALQLCFSLGVRGLHFILVPSDVFTIIRCCLNSRISSSKTSHSVRNGVGEPKIDMLDSLSQAIFLGREQYLYLKILQEMS